LSHKRDRLSSQQIEQAVRFILQHQGAQRISIIAHSWGTMATGLFAGRRPELVDRLVFFAPIAGRTIGTDAKQLPAWYVVSLQQQRDRFVATEVEIESLQSQQRPDVDVYQPDSGNCENGWREFMSDPVSIPMNKTTLGLVALVALTASLGSAQAGTEDATCKLVFDAMARMAASQRTVRPSIPAKLGIRGERRASGRPVCLRKIT
jgi:pimeloyl-ACP methyl ester carboxylesterase